MRRGENPLADELGSYAQMGRSLKSREAKQTALISSHQEKEVKVKDYTMYAQRSWEQIRWDGMIEIRDEEHNQIARLGQLQDGAIPNAETRANARLIAAAPELLNTVKILSVWINNLPDGGNLELVEMADKVIRKATNMTLLR